MSAFLFQYQKSSNRCDKLYNVTTFDLKSKINFFFQINGYNKSLIVASKSLSRFLFSFFSEGKNTVKVKHRSRHGKST